MDNYTDFEKTVVKILKDVGAVAVPQEIQALVKTQMKDLFDLYRAQRMAGLEAEKEGSKPIIIDVEGGVINDIRHPTAGKAIVYDWDTDGVPEEDLFMTDGGEKCVRSLWDLENDDTGEDPEEDEET